MLLQIENFTQDDLQMLEDLAGCFFTEEEAALFLEIDPAFMEESFRNKQNEIYRRYQKGWMQSEFDLRKSIKTLSTSGSHPAQTMLDDIRRKAATKRYNL